MVYKININMGYKINFYKQCFKIFFIVYVFFLKLEMNEGIK